MRFQKYPSLTALRALELLCALDVLPQENISKSSLENIRRALRDHVRHAIVAGARRRRR
jgi:hypothetical protein